MRIVQGARAERARRAFESLGGSINKLLLSKGRKEVSKACRASRFQRRPTSVA
jgi:hypothetical protein